MCYGPAKGVLGMKNFKLVSLLFVGMLGLTSCIKNPADINKDFDKKLEEDNKNRQAELEQLTLSFSQGGQPGLITISGIIVDGNSKTDVRISVNAVSGKSKDGTTPAVGNTFKPVLSSTIEKLDLSKQSEDKTLLAVGCDEKIVAEMAKERSLDIQVFKKPENTVLAVSAKTILLCGDLKDFHPYQFTQVDADELILSNLNFIHIGMLGGLTFNTNKLLLIGSNKIESNGIDLSFTASMTPTLDLRVAKEISSTDDGKLLLSSTGSNYKEDIK